MMGHGRKAATIIAEQLENYFNVGVWYEQRRIVDAVTKACDEALLECYTQNCVDFMPGFKSLRQSMLKMRRVLIKDRPRWRHQSRRLEQLLQLKVRNTESRPHPSKNVPATKLAID
jgi:hypothetical protein